MATVAPENGASSVAFWSSHEFIWPKPCNSYKIMVIPGGQKKNSHHLKEMCAYNPQSKPEVWKGGEKEAM